MQAPTAKGNEFVVVSHGPNASGHGSGERGQPNNAFQMSLQSLGIDLSLEEAVQKMRDLMKENMELRETVNKNSDFMRQQFTVLNEWKSRQEQEKSKNKMYHDKAKQVVTELREDVAMKDEEIGALQQELIRMQQEFKEGAGHTATQGVSQLQHKLENVTQEKQELVAQNMNLRAELQSLHKQKQEYVMVAPGNIPATVDEQRVTATIENSETTETIFDDAMSAPTNEEERLQSGRENDLTRQVLQLQAKLGESAALVKDRDVQISALQRKCQDAKVDQLRRDLQQAQEREAAVQGRMEEAIQRERKEHQQQIETMQAQYRTYVQTVQKQAKAPEEEVQTLRNQVIQLTQDLSEKDMNIREMKKRLQEGEQRLTAMDSKCRLLQEDLNKNQEENDDLIVALQRQNEHLKTSIKQQSQKCENLSNANHAMRSKYDQLATDYHKLLESGSPGASSVEADRQTAQVVGLEEAVAKRDGKLEMMMEENQVLKAQAEIFRQDFEVERKARENIHAEKEELMLRNNELLDQLQALSETQIAAMQRQHASQAASPSYHLRNMHGYANVQQQQQPMGPAPGAGHPPPGEQREPRSQVTRPLELRCPICSAEFPDVDSLQVHTMGCLDS